MGVCKVPGCGRPTVARGLCGKHYQRETKNYNLPVSERINQDAFKVVDEKCCYFLGILYGDGWLAKKANRNCPVLGLKLNDEDVVRAYGEYLNLPDKVKSHVRSNSSYIKESRYWSLETTYAPLLENVQNLGLSYTKTVAEEEPNIPREMYKHFVRGLMDSDGSIKTDKRVDFYVSGPLVEWLENLLNDLGFLYSTRISYSSDSTEIHCVQLKVRNNNSIRFLDWLYKDATVYMARKYNRYLELK